MSNASIARAGFVRMPRAWISLDVSPGARVLLLHFCSAANGAGESWYRFSQLSEIVGRSKSAISGYLSELRDAGVVETEQQRTANGFHAHLLVRLVDWSSFQTEWATMAAAKRSTRSATRAHPEGRPSTTHRDTPEGTNRDTTGSKRLDERRVQSNEHRYPTDTNYNHSTNSTAQQDTTINDGASIVSEWSPEHEHEWVSCKGAANGLAFEKPPSLRLLHRAIRHSETLMQQVGWLEENEGSAEATSQLLTFAKNTRVELHPHVNDVAREIHKRARTASAIEKAIECIADHWQPHWRRLSTPKQVAKLLDAESSRLRMTGADELKAIRARSRASMARLELKRRELSTHGRSETGATVLAARTVAPAVSRRDTAGEASFGG